MQLKKLSNKSMHLLNNICKFYLIPLKNYNKKIWVLINPSKSTFEKKNFCALIQTEGLKNDAWEISSNTCKV